LLGLAQVGFHIFAGKNFFFLHFVTDDQLPVPENTKGGSITVPLTSCLVWNQLYDNWQFLFLFAKQTNPKPVKQEVNGTVILPPLVFPGCAHWSSYLFRTVSCPSNYELPRSRSEIRRVNKPLVVRWNSGTTAMYSVVLRLIYTSDFRARFRSKLVRS
jgi:hypothetical protein